MKMGQVVSRSHDHNLREGKGTPGHLRILMARYLIEHLPPGSRQK
jgi:hypothetical protein